MWKVLLYAHDFSECAARVEPVVIGLARTHGARVVVCHVSQLTHGLSANTLITPPGEEGPMPIGEYTRRASLARLEAIADRLRARGVETTVHALIDDLAPGILRAADELCAHAIVMGTHGRSGLEHLLLGSVAEKVLRQASIPVITLRTPAKHSHLREDEVLEDERAG